MSSSMLPGDRRWGSAKRGGMTVLGKVVVPKPINLPSQRSENHGLDPNVEIVPKGTLTWGNKSSSAWGLVSPNTDGGSPSHLSGRPSSGSGTSPSTASSDRAHDLTNNSRPASASGALTSNQTSLASLRPRSAETRPGSSQLSRFAENSEHPGAWSAAGTAEKSGGTSTNDEFSLTSGDFPTLGSGKESSVKGTDPQDANSYCRPGSSSGGGGPLKDSIGAAGAADISANENVKNGNVNSWRRDNPPHTNDGGRPGGEKWQGNPHTYPGPPQHYDAWHGAPVNNPQGGVWFRGPPAGPPYGNPVGPGGYPMEPFPYYRPQIPAGGLPNTQPVPPPGPGPRGPHPKNGDMFRPHMPDAYMRPGMPVRPGFYPGPVAYDGYYNPPMSYCGPNERDVPYMGMPPGPPVYHRYPVQGAPEPGNPHGKTGGYGPTNQSQLGEQAESGHPQDKLGPYKVLLKQHDGWDRKNEEQRGESVVTNNTRGDQPRPSSWEDDWKPDHNKEGERDLRKPLGEEANFQTVDNQGSVSVPAKSNPPGSRGNAKVAEDISGNKLEDKSFVLSKDPQPRPASAPKDSVLIMKIEGLNAKARASDGRNETITVSDPGNLKNKFQAHPKANKHTKEPGGGSSHPEINSLPREGEGDHYSGDKNLDSTASAGANITRRPTHGTQSRGDHHGRGRFNTVEVDGRQNKPLISQPPVLVPPVHLETSNSHVQEHHRSSEARENLGPRPHGKSDSQSMLPMFDRTDSQEQRAKMKELAKQRTKQLQEEEEERTKRQMAKARAKLEELDRRTQATEESTQKLENASSGVVTNKQDESQIHSESSTAGRTHGPQSSKQGIVYKSNENHAIEVNEPTSPSGGPSSESPKSAHIKSQVESAQSAPLQQEIKGANVTLHDNAPQVDESSVSKPKRTSSKQKHLTSTTEARKTKADVEDNVITSARVAANEIVSSDGLNLPVNSNAAAETSLHPRKKSNKYGKNKHRNEDRSSSSSSLGPKENLASGSLETGLSKPSENQLDPSPMVQLQANSRDVDRLSEQHPLSPNEDSHSRGNSHWKPQQSRRMPRNQQSNRSGEKYHGGEAAVWAPVRSHNKAEVADEASAPNVIEEVSPPVKPDNQVQNNSKNKRAEMERYVPKPVAKEMAQQGNTNPHPVAPVVNQATTTVDSSARAGANNTASQVPEDSHNASVIVGKMVLSFESKGGNNRHNKQQGKTHGSWRQRGTAELTSTQGLVDGSSYTSSVSQNVQKSSEPPHTQKPDPVIVKEQEKCSDGWNDWGIAEDYVEPVSVPPVKDQGATARGKRHSSKGHRGPGNTHDLNQKKSYSEDTDKHYNQSTISDMSPVDQSAPSKENRGVGERSMPHWQPKSQALPANSHRGNRHNSSQNAWPEVAWASKAESNLHKPVSPPLTHDKDAIERSNAGQAQNLRNQEPGRERKPAPFKGQLPHLPNQDLPNPVEPVPVNMDPRQEQRMSTGFRKNGNQNARFSQSHETGGWNSSGQDNRQHNPPPNRERQRQNPRYEYQPVEPYNKSNNFEGPKDSAENSGSRGRGRGQNHSRRGGGNFYGRRSEV